MRRVNYLLDTNIVGYYLRRMSPALERTMRQALLEQICAISVITRAELALMAKEDRQRELIGAFLRQVPSLPWTTSAADQFGALKSHNRMRGITCGDIDTQIAAHALTENLTLVTHNMQTFTEMPGLRVVDWMK
jgi:predicted nucleic acid-binding protein